MHQDEIKNVYSDVLRPSLQNCFDRLASPRALKSNQLSRSLSVSVIAAIGFLFRSFYLLCLSLPFLSCFYYLCLFSPSFYLLYLFFLLSLFVFSLFISIYFSSYLSFLLVITMSLLLISFLFVSTFFFLFIAPVYQVIFFLSLSIFLRYSLFHRILSIRQILNPFGRNFG